MVLRVFSVLGAALNFSGRRFETIARVAWLPLLLLMIVDMTTVFAMLSVIYERTITFRDAVTFANAERALAAYIQPGLSAHPVALSAIAGISIVFQGILSASMMAPLIRLAGLGEQPAGGILRLRFGPDQLRYLAGIVLSGAFMFIIVLLPLFISAVFILAHIGAGLSTVMASFPDAQSLHTITLVTHADSLALRGMGWMTKFAYPFAAAAPFGVLFWLVMLFHFSPTAPGVLSWLLRAITTLIFSLLFFASIIYVFFGNGAPISINFESGVPKNAAIFVILIIVALFLYINIRLFPYAGMVVIQRSMSLAGTFRLSRQGNLIRLAVLLTLTAIILSAVSFILNQHLIAWIQATVGMVYQLTASSSRLLNSGVTAEWITPVFTLFWSGLKVFLNLLYSLFSIGVLAGLYGSLYIESEKLR